MNKVFEHSLIQLTLMRFRLFFREPEAVFWILVFPILLSLGLGAAFRNLPADIVRVGATTKQLTQALNSNKELSATTLDEVSGARSLATGGVLLLAIQTPSGVVYRYDNTNPQARTARLLADHAIQSWSGRGDPIHSSDDLVHEAGSRYIDFVVPGVLGMNLLGSAIWWLCFAIVGARQKKLLKRLVASPMPRWHYIAAFPISSLLLLVGEVVLFLGFARLVFNVPFRGSLWQLGALCLLASLSFAAIGLLISSRAATMEAASGWTNFTMFPMWILSGIFFSPSRFPSVIQPLVRALPLTAAIDAFRANMLLGAGIRSLSGPIVVMLAWLIVPFLVSLKIFRWQ
jgi:ABC-2 type transport system permease protein